MSSKKALRCDVCAKKWEGVPTALARHLVRAHQWAPCDAADLAGKLHEVDIGVCDRCDRIATVRVLRAKAHRTSCAMREVPIPAAGQPATPAQAAATPAHAAATPMRATRVAGCPVVKQTASRAKYGSVHGIHEGTNYSEQLFYRPVAEMLVRDDFPGLVLDVQDRLREPTSYTDQDDGEDAEQDDDVVEEEDDNGNTGVSCKSGDLSTRRASLRP